MAIIFIRTLIIYFSLLLIMRLLGKRQLGEMELSEFVVAALIADLASHPLQDIGIPMINGLVPIVTLFCCEVLISGVAMKNIRLRALLFGKPSMLVEKGKIRQKEMKKNRFTTDELMEELRNQGYPDISSVEYAVLETDGRLSVIPYPSEAPVTPAQLKIEAEDKGYPVVVISDGHVIQSNLRLVGRDMNWLKQRLAALGIKDTKQVFLMTVNSAGQVYYTIKEPEA
ncbi:MAG: DUF421 domain-containing protein [Candidatus Limivicinus sp.]|nr:DUF421 domain-containing protein [Candidatus Limivicinus sp.]